MPHMMSAGGAGFYGSEHAPFVIESNPVQADFEVQDLRPLEKIGSDRQARRSRLLADVEKLERESGGQGRAKAMSTYYQRARDLMTSAEARKAFDIQSEPESVRKTYGYTALGQCASAGSPAGRGGLPLRRHRSRRLGPSLHDLPEPGKGHAAARRSGLQRPG